MKILTDKIVHKSSCPQSRITQAESNFIFFSELLGEKKTNETGSKNLFI